MIADDALLNYAKKPNICFVNRFNMLYNNCSTVYNVHGLLHIADDVKMLGNLDSYSAFPFESFLGVLKTKVHSGWKPLAQVCRRLSEIGTIARKDKLRANKKVEITINNNIIIPGKFKDSCVLLHDKSICLVKARSKKKVILKKFIKKSALFTKPCDSSILDMYTVSQKNEMMEKKISEIKCKCFIYPRKNGHAIIPLL